MAIDQEETANLSVYYDEKDPEIGKQAHDILVKYSGIPEEDLVKHVRGIRDRAWKVFKYPCVGNYYFLDLSISEADEYSQVLERVKNGDKILDLACCFGQDIRKLVFDGAPIENVSGSELEQGFLDLGFDLFNDRKTMNDNFTSGDFFNEEVAGLKGKQFDLIHAASFFHLFSREEQLEVVTRAVNLLKPKAGSMIFGRQTAVDVAKEIEHAASRSGLMYRHDTASFKKLVAEVADSTGKKLECSVKLARGHEELNAKLGWFRVSFTIVIQ